MKNYYGSNNVFAASQSSSWVVSWVSIFLLIKEGLQSMADIGSGFSNNVKKMRTVVKAKIGKATDITIGPYSSVI